MPLWRICDDNWYWFIPFQRIEYGDPDVLVLDDKGDFIPQPNRAVEMNLWRCRHCAAMVPGGGRTEHQQFHERVGK